MQVHRGAVKTFPTWTLSSLGIMKLKRRFKGLVALKFDCIFDSSEELSILIIYILEPFSTSVQFESLRWIPDINRFEQ